MTREEAIKALKWFKAYNEEDYCGGDRIQNEHGDWYYRITEQDFEAFDMAIKALEQEPTPKNDVPENNVGNIYICSCGYGWDKSKVVRYHFCPNCGKAVASATKNDLGVDWENYKDVDGNSLDDLILEVLQNNFDCGNTYGYKVADEIIALLPSVTPIRPKGHWIEQIDYEENCRTLICSNCDRPALHDGDSIWKHKFCPHCGADMKEVKE